MLYPYVYLSARAMFQFQSAEYGEAARTLGASSWTVFWRVSLPMARPALAVGVALVSLETLNDIGASEYLGVRTLTVSIFTTWLNRGSLAGAAQLSCLMLATVAGLIALERYGRRNATTEFSAESPRLTPRTALAGSKSLVGICRLPAAGAARLRGAAALSDAAEFQARIAGEFRHVAVARRLQLGRVRNPCHAGCAAACVCDHSGLALAAARAALLAMNVSQTGYALPGLVLALGLLTPVLAIDHSLNALAGWAGRSLPGLVLVGSGAAVVIAYTIRFLAVPTGLIKAGFERIPRDYDDSARAAGAGASHHDAADPSAAAAAGDAGRRHHRVRGLPEGIAGDAVAAAAQCRNAGDLDLPVRQPRQF